MTHARPDSLGVLDRFPMTHSDQTIARCLAATFVAGPLEVNELVARGAKLLGRSWRWLPRLAHRICGEFQHRPRPRRTTVEEFLLGDSVFQKACERHELEIADYSITAQMCPVDAARNWPVPPLCTFADTADWLNVRSRELEWFADLRGLAARASHQKLRHYHYRTLSKRFGQVRLIEAPKLRLKEIQRQILREILDAIPAHNAAHGFCAGRSIKTFAAGHVATSVVLRMDLRDFFPSISRAQVEAVFRSVGYAESVANVLAGLCTNCAPDDIWDGVEVPVQQLRSVIARYARPHLPQGAPTSPALANLCAYRIDCRLAGLAESAGATYTRYADDLAFSGGDEFRRSAKRFSLHASAIVMDEGFDVNHRKTRIMQSGARQRLAGIVVNAHTNVPRKDYDRLKAILVNCLRSGPQSQNRDQHADFRAHLNGRVAYVELINPPRGKKLRELFRRIDW